MSPTQRTVTETTSAGTAPRRGADAYHLMGTGARKLYAAVSGHATDREHTQRLIAGAAVAAALLATALRHRRAARAGEDTATALARYHDDRDTAERLLRDLAALATLLVALRGGRNTEEHR